MQITDRPSLLDVGASPGSLQVVNDGPNTLYYGTASTISSSSNDGSVAAGSSRTFMASSWLVTASALKTNVSVVTVPTPVRVQGSPLEGTDGWRSNLDSRLNGTIATTLTGGVMRLGFGLRLYAGETVTKIRGYSHTTAANGPTNQWFCLVDGSLNVLAKTVNDLTTAWGASTAKTLDIATDGANNTITGYRVPSNQIVYIGIVLTATTTVPTMQAIAVSAPVNNETPIIGAVSSDTGLTTPALCPATLAGLTGSVNPVFARALVV